MLAVKNRLRNKKDIEAVFRFGQGQKEGFIFLKILKNHLNEIRIGFVVSQKVAKKAVLRNRIKRRLRSLMAKRMQKIQTGLDLIFVALPGIAEKDYAYLETTLDKLLIKAKCLKNNKNNTSNTR